MGKSQFCRVCRTENNLKYTTKELRKLNKKQLLLAQSTLQGQVNNRASKKLLLTTPTLGNICLVCDERIQIFHRLDEGGRDSNSDVEIEVVNHANETLQRSYGNLVNREFLQGAQRPETPVIVDDDEMLFDIFMQKFDQKTQLSRHHSAFSQQEQLEKQFSNQFHTTYTPPQSTGGGSEGDEAKVIEVLTSHESTPAPLQPLVPSGVDFNIVDPQGHRIVAIIELDDADENEKRNDYESANDLFTGTKNSSHIENLDKRGFSPPSKTCNFENLTIHKSFQTANLEDDDEIIFRKVDPEKEKGAGLKKRKRKYYDENKLRLVASLNLVSSDSETEESSLKVQLQKIPNTPANESFQFIKQKSFSCNICKINFPDSESLLVHERIHRGVMCTLCQLGFQQVKRLVHHMRYKHREYNGDTLLEKPRSKQDSCMTIRLRYMQRTTFYECQLCGRIDDVFKEHKDHIIEKHPNESKSLKDPIMKQLKCPVCKAKCGSQYLSLCRHLISLHEYQDYKGHLRELIHVSSFGWNPARQQEVAKTAKIFQFIKRKTFFFECKLCHKVVAGYLHHLRHVKGHLKSVNQDTKVEETKSSSVAPFGASNLGTLCKSLKKDRGCTSEKLRKRDDMTKRFVRRTNINKNAKQFGRDKTKKLQKPKETDVQNSKLKSNNQTKKLRKQIKTAKCKEIEGVNITAAEAQLKIKLKSKHKVLEDDLPKSLKLTKVKLKKELNKKGNKNFKKTSPLELKPQLRKVKVKTPIRQIELQQYKCKYCFRKFKGFRLYNLHLLQQHKENEYIECNNCCKIFTNSSNFKEHVNKCPPHMPFFISKAKRKFCKQTALGKTSEKNWEACLKKVPNQNDLNSVDIGDNCLWLKDLLKLKNPHETSDTSLTFYESRTALLTRKPFNFQCCFCLHLFANDNDLQKHKQHHHLQNSNILIKYKPFKDQ